MVSDSRFLIAFVLILLSSWSKADSSEEPCVLKLVYKDKGKAGYMAPAPSNEGLYKALYSGLAESAGCQLRIERYPKKRTLLLIKLGKADLYPSTGFDQSRSDFMYYIPNGLHRFEPYYGLAPIQVKQLNDISQLKDHGLTWIFEAGNTTLNIANELGVASEQVFGLTDARAIEMLRKGRSVFYRIIKGDYEQYLKMHSLADLESYNISTHERCCPPKSQTLYLGISKMSKYYVDEPNPDYDPADNLSAENSPVRVKTDTVVYKIMNELDKLKQSGKVNELFNQYILAPGHTP